MMFVDLIILLVIVGLVSVWLDRRFMRKKQAKAAQQAEGGK